MTKDQAKDIITYYVEILLIGIVWSICWMALLKSFSIGFYTMVLWDVVYGIVLHYKLKELISEEIPQSCQK